MKTFNKLIFLASLVLSSVQAGGADHEAILGDWVAEMNARGRTAEFKLEIQQNSTDGIEAKMVTPRGTNSLANFEVNGDEISGKNARTGGTVSLDFIADELRGAIPSPRGERNLVSRRVQ